MGIVLAILIVALLFIKLNEAKALAAGEQQATEEDYRQQALDAYGSFSLTSCGSNFDECITRLKNYASGGQKGITLNSNMFLGAFT